jgi:hypothetical protein
VCVCVCVCVCPSKCVGCSFSCTTLYHIIWENEVMKLACSGFEMESVWFRSLAHGGTDTVLPFAALSSFSQREPPGGTSFTGRFCCSPGRNGSQFCCSCGILVWGDFVALNLGSRCMELLFAYFLHSSVQYSLFFFQHFVHMLSNRPNFNTVPAGNSDLRHGISLYELSRRE